MAYTRADKFTETVSIPQTYSDFSNSFTKHPVSNELIVLKNADSVKQAFKNMIQTYIGERLFQPFFGSNMRRALFELSGPFFEEDVKRYIYDAARHFESRVGIVSIDINPSPDEISYRIDITFSLINSTTLSSITVYLKRAR